MKFTIAISASPQCAASRRALYFAKAVLSQGHIIERLFFYKEGVYNAVNNTVSAQDELNMAEQWHEFIVKHKLDAVICIASALKRGLLDVVEAQRYNKTAITIDKPWLLSGLGQLHDAIQQSDRFISFGGMA